MKISRSLQLASVVAVLVAHAGATKTFGQAPTPARDNTTARKGTGRIRGRVMAAETGTVLRRATVSLTAVGNTGNAGPTMVVTGGDQAGTVMFQAAGNGNYNGTYGTVSNYSAPSNNDKLVDTDAEGRFEFSDLPAGRYTLAASKGGYVSLAYGERRLLEGGRPIDLADGQGLAEVNFTLPRAGVIVARVTDQYGEPINGITVEAQQFRYSDGERRLTTVSGASIVGLTTTDDGGEQRAHGLPPGDYYVVAGQGVDSRFALAGNGQVYIATYYPGSTESSGAQIVKVAAGQETPVTIAMQTSRIARIAGKVVHADGTQYVPQRLSITRQVGDNWTTATMGFLADQTFAMPRFVPGDYWLEVLDAPSASGAGPREFARMPLHITGEDAFDVVVTTKPLQTLRGHAVFDTGAPPASLRPAAVHLRTLLTVAGSGHPGSATWGDGWSFEMTGVIGTGVFRMAPPLSGWFLKAVLLDGRDITDTPVDFENVGSTHDLQIVLTQKNAVVTGGVVNAANAATSDYSVVLFPADREQWTSRTRLTGLGRPDQAGRFKIDGLPPGRYLAVAVESIEAGEEHDPEFFKSLSDRATAVTLDEGGSQQVNLRLVDR